MSHHSSFSLEGNITICRDDEVFLGAAQVRLLKQVYTDGSILAASKSLKMSYQHAWHIIDKVNQLSPLPVVVRQKGGRDGGGCMISPYGKRLIQLYDKKMEELREFFEKGNSDLTGCFF
ncbi:MAG TPA: winged helix-turn-helix domain-containing protein [Paludibacter sp.]|nr:winged helix-turn-helix domain-containing protein [Paludibacter sp.]